MKRLVIAAALGGLAAGGTALAQDEMGGPRRGGGMMARADTDGDGAVSRAEYQAQADARFARRDANGDGVLGADERPTMSRAGGPDAPPAPAGPVTRDQFRADAMARFDRADANHDGKLDRAEMAAGMRAMFGGRSNGPPPAGN